MLTSRECTCQYLPVAWNSLTTALYQIDTAVGHVVGGHAMCSDVMEYLGPTGPVLVTVRSKPRAPQRTNTRGLEWLPRSIAKGLGWSRHKPLGFSVQQFSWDVALTTGFNEQLCLQHLFRVLVIVNAHDEA